MGKEQELENNIKNVPGIMEMVFHGIVFHEYIYFTKPIKL
jgi:hypothetical protein